MSEKMGCLAERKNPVGRKFSSAQKKILVCSEENDFIFSKAKVLCPPRRKKALALVCLPRRNEKYCLLTKQKQNTIHVFLRKKKKENSCLLINGRYFLYACSLEAEEISCCIQKAKQNKKTRKHCVCFKKKKQHLHLYTTTCLCSDN